MKNFLNTILALCLYRYFTDADSSVNLKSRFFRFPIGNLSVVWQGFIPILAMTAIFSSGIRGGGRELEYFLFAMFNFFVFMSIVAEVTDKGMSILFKLERIPQINIILVEISGILFNAINYFVVLVIVMIVATALGLSIPWYWVLYSFLLHILIAIVWSIPIGIFCQLSAFFKSCMKWFRRGLFFTSSILIPVPLMPPGIRDILLFNPLVHVNEQLKYQVTGISYSFIDISYAFYFIFAFLLFCLPITYLKVKYISNGTIQLREELEKPEMI